jgi:hypothetical protein
MIKTCRFLAAVLLAVGLASRICADPAAMIAKARAYLGPEAKLEAIHSIHYVGSLIGEETVPGRDGKNITRPFRAGIDIVFQKPYRQRVVLASYKGVEITALDDYEAWRYLDKRTDPKRKSLMLLGKDQIKSQRASTWENLAFFRGIEECGGHVEDLGPQVIDGHACEKLAFVHDAVTTFYRYFDQATGRLLLLELSNGDRVREEGEILVDGVRFPQTLINTTKNRVTGKETTMTIKLKKITFNEIYPESTFAVPMFTAK